MRAGVAGAFGAELKALRQTAGFTQEELATIAGLSVHAVSALERGERRKPHVETVRALSAALDLTGPMREAFMARARAGGDDAVEELSAVALPLSLTDLLGRDDDVRMLRQWLSDPGARLITLLGAGGVGKTRLALHVARAIADDSATRVVFVPLASIRQSELAASAIAEALGLVDISASDLPRRARAACERRPTLMVLDNLEQVADAAPLVADLLTSVPGLRLLITSRAPVHVRGEREYNLSPLAVGADAVVLPPADLARVPAVRLFLQRVHDVLPDFQLTPANAPVVAAICRRLDGLPLALELVAPWLKMLTAEDVLRRLEDGVLLFTVGRRDLPERQQTMNATVAWSYQLLDADEQGAFRRLGVLPGRFSIEAAAAVLADTDGSAGSVDQALTAAARLIDKSLLLRVEPSTTSRPLYQMLETVRAYASLALTDAGQHGTATERLVNHCVREATLAAEGLVGPAQAEWLDRVRDDLDNYRCALGWLIEHERAASAADIVWAMWPFWFTRGYAAEGRSWYEKTLSVPSPPAAAESKALVGAAFMCYSQGELSLARTRLNRAIALAGSVDEQEVIALAENLSGRVEHAFGDVEAARARFDRSAERYRARSIKWGIGSALTGRAAVALTTGDFDQAERLLDEATSELQQTGPWFLTLSLNVRAILAVRRSEPNQAIAFVRESLTRVRALQDKLSFVHAMAILAAAAAQKRYDAWAARIVGAKEAVTERTGARVADTSLDELQQHAEREVRARLGPARWADAYAAGRVTTIDALLKDIDHALADQ
jgi:predicted ATPase/transcriptional regulator with XRE-family HTH domain